MKKHDALIEALDSELLDALAADKRRASRAAPELKAAALTRAAEVAREALDAKDAEVERSYRQSSGRLVELGKLIGQAKKDRGVLADKLEASRKGQARDEYQAGIDRLDADLRNYQAEQGVLFGQAIDLARDLDMQTGRFIRSARKHDRQVGMLATDEADIVMLAVELCYRDERALTVVTVGWADKRPVELTVPTVGGMYRNLKRAHRMELNRFRQARKGLTALYSLDALKDAGVEPSDMFEHYGHEFGMPSDEALDALMQVRNASASRLALTLADAEAQRVDKSDESRMRDRMAAATVGDAPRVLKVAVKQIAAGASLADVARKLGIRPKSLEAAIRSASWGATA